MVFTRHNGPARERNRDTGHSRECQSGTRKLGGHEGIFWVLEMPWNLTWNSFTSFRTLGSVHFVYVNTISTKYCGKNPKTPGALGVPGRTGTARVLADKPEVPPVLWG